MLVKKPENISIKMKRITAIAFDSKNLEQYELFALNIRKNLDPRF
jgi:hypothetical protein